MQPFNFYLITDTHYFATKLGCYGKTYNERMLTEQKCFAETQAINEAVFEYLCRAQDADTVLIAGDLSFNGEKESHLEFLELLKGLKASGKRIFVITAGHDFNDAPPCYKDEICEPAEGTRREELYDLYFEYGFKDAIAVDRASLSYVAQLTDGIRLLALNNDGLDNSKTYSAGQIEWILRQTAKAREDGQMMIAMNHYPLLPACPLFALIGDAVMPNHDTVTTLLADEGVHLCFTGHMHNQSIKLKTTESGNRFWDVCTGSIIGDPAYMRFVSVENDRKIKINSIPVPEFKWDMEGLTNEEYFKRQFNMMINTYLDFMKDDPKRLLGKFGIKDASDAAVKLVGKLGKAADNATVGGICSRLCVKCPETVKAMPFRELALNLVRNIFAGNAPYIEGTPEYEAVMGIVNRFSPLLKPVGKKLGADIPDMIKNTIGHYGVDEYNTELLLY